MKVADPNGDWELELNMAEDRMGHIANAQNEFGKDLDVTYILATDPDVELKGKVKEVAESAEVSGEEGNTVVQSEWPSTRKQLPHLKVGATVTGKVHCGKRPSGYVWLHDPIAFVYSKVSFPALGKRSSSKCDFLRNPFCLSVWTILVPHA